MRKFAFTVLSLLLLAALPARAQFSEKATIFGGMSYQFIGIAEPNATAPQYLGMYGLGMGFNYVLAHSNDVASIGINPNGNACLQLSSYGISFFGNVPVYMMARLGAGSTPYNEQKVGIGAGIGGTFSYLTSYSSGQKLSTSFINPSAIAELAINARGGAYLFRFNWSLMRPLQKVFLDGSPYDYRLGVLGASIFYYF